MLQRMGLMAFIGSRGTSDGLTQNLVVVGSSPTRPTEETRCIPMGLCLSGLGVHASQCPLDTPH